MLGDGNLFQRFHYHTCLTTACIRQLENGLFDGSIHHISSWMNLEVDAVLKKKNDFC
jgi:hypothetical protein